MLAKFYTPHILLQEFINCIMIVHVELEAAGAPVICPYPPTPQNSLFFYIRDRVKVHRLGDESFIVQPRSVIVGPQLTRVSLDINRNHKAVRVGFHPGGLFRLLGIPMHEMIDEAYDATDVFGSELNEINDKLSEANDFDKIHEVIEKFLLKKISILKRALPFDRAILDLLRLNGNVSIDRVASLACLSLRQFERVCHDRLGLPPKVFARLIRFSKAYRIREDKPNVSWTSIAHECGYFDQMHMIRDFKEFAGVLPGVIEKELSRTHVRLQPSLRL